MSKSLQHHRCACYAHSAGRTSDQRLAQRSYLRLAGLRLSHDDRPEGPLGQSGAEIMQQAVIVDAVRTPMGRGKPGGALSGIHPSQLLATVLKALIERSGLDPAEVDD